MRGLLSLGDRDLTDFGLIIERLEGTADGLVADGPTGRVSERAGEVVLGGDIPTGVREITVLGYLEADTPEGLDARISALEQWCRRAPTWVRTSRQPDREWRTSAIPPRVRIAIDAPFGPAVSATVDLAIRCDDPVAVERVALPLSLGPLPRQVPLWSMASTGQIRAHGPATNVAVEYRGVTGALLGYLRILQALGANDYVVFDLEDLSVALSANGVASDITALLTSDSYWFVLNPDDGAPDVGIGPTLTIASPESAHGELLYARRSP